MELNGELVGIHVFDNTSDSSAFGSITITNLDNNSVIFSNTYGDLGPFNSNSSFDAQLLLPYDTLIQVTMQAREFSLARIYFGATQVAAAGWHNGSPNPTYTTQFTIASVAEPELMGFLAFALLATIVGARRRRVQ